MSLCYFSKTRIILLSRLRHSISSFSILSSKNSHLHLFFNVLSIVSLINGILFYTRVWDSIVLNQTVFKVATVSYSYVNGMILAFMCTYLGGC